MSHNHRFLVAAVLLLASACSNSATESRTDGATPVTGGAGGITSTPASSGGSSATSVLSSSAGGSSATATTGGASTSSGGSSGQTGGTGGGRTGGTTANGGGGTGGSSRTGGTTASLPNTSIDASVEADAGPDGPVLAQCLDYWGYPVFKVCTDDTSISTARPHYMGRVIAVETFAPDAGSLTIPCGNFPATIGTPQSFTLALQDGGTVKMVYGSSEDVVVPSLAAWKGQTVTVDVTPTFNGGYFAGSSLLVSDSKGLVLAGAYSMGGAFTSEAVGSTGITVSAGAAVCEERNPCGHLQREIVFAGTTTVSLPYEKQGSFKVGSLNFTGVSLGCSERQKDSNCADGYSWASWAIWRDAP